MDIGRLAARTVIGGLFIGHGTQKLFGWFGGPGLEGTEQMMGALHMRPTRLNAIAAGVSETAGGALLAAGAATPLAASALIGTMVTAIRTVHQPKGVWVSQGGWEYNAVIIASLVALIDAGPGDVSVDAALGRREWGPGWAVGGLALGAAASAATLAVSRRVAAHEETESGEPAGTAGSSADSGIAQATTDDTPGDPTTKDSDG